ncbi:universal stress protein [Cupriavidus pauculus]|uniref:universal stress protein n=1 Tax=Cupriavidus pauculus TaxID=82633 RepID=UPI001D0C6A2E|nr:universal stress protein [Cupriavidus pauculus]
MVAIDNSACSSRALEESIREAALRRCCLEILHVVDYGFLKHDQHLLDVSSIRRDRAAAGHALLQTAATRANANQLEHSVQLIDDMATLGDVAGRILKYVRDTCPALVVVGTHGKTGLTRAVLGSVADQLVRHSPVPVLVVRQDMQPETLRHSTVPGAEPIRY